MLYSADKIIERNSGYETKTYAPGFTNIGDDYWRQHLLQADGDWLYHIIAEHNAERDTMMSKIISHQSQQTGF